MRKSIEEFQAELDYVTRTLFLRGDSSNLLIIIKEERIIKVLDLFSISALDLENLSFTLPSKEILKLDPYEIGLTVIFKRNHPNPEIKSQE